MLLLLTIFAVTKPATPQSSAWLGAKLCTILQDRDAMHLLLLELSQLVPLLLKAMMNLGHIGPTESELATE